MTQEFSTGIDRLDQVLSGGLSAGSVVAVETPPETQGELLLRSVAAGYHTIYLTGTRSADDIEAWFEEIDATLDVYDMVETEPASVLSTVLRDMPPESVVIVDPIDVIERSGLTRDSFVKVLRLVGQCGRETNSLVVLHALDTPSTPELRGVTRQLADSVWSLVIDEGTSTLDTRLRVTKRRNRVVPGESLKLELGEEVTVDSSRDIG